MMRIIYYRIRKERRRTCVTTADVKCLTMIWAIQKNITDKTFEDSAKAMDQTVEEAKKNTLALLRKELEENQNRP